MNVLVAVPYRHGTPWAFLRGMCHYFANMTYPQREIALMPITGQYDGRKYSPHAFARNTLIATCLGDSHTHVLWLDVDLLNVPADLIERLAAGSDTAVVAPFVFVERIDVALAAEWGNGGGFYDTGGFWRNGKAIAEYPPYWDGYNGGPVEVDSVGCCYLVPADAYRQGARYDPVGDEVEHLSFFRAVRALGMKVYATDSVSVTHAYLPRYQ